MFAHYYTSTVRGIKQHVLILSATPQPHGGKSMTLPSKKAVVDAAKAAGAKPWNF
jgi:hypothetical protein